MRRPHCVAGMLPLILMVGVGLVFAQGYPNKPIRILTSAVGGSADFAARVLAQELSSSALGQQVIVENRGGILQSEVVARALPDGYTLLVSGNLWTLPLTQKVTFDPVKDFLPITAVANTPNILVVHPSVPARSVKELIALARAKPGELNYASGPTGATSHLATELFKAMAGVDIVRIPFKGSALALNAVLSGDVQIVFSTAAVVIPHVKSGKVYALAVSSAQPSQLFPGLPTVAASGLPGYEAGSMIGVFAPAGTPAMIVNRLNQEIVRVLNRVEVKEKFFTSGADTVGNLPRQFAAFINSDMTTLRKLIKDLGIKQAE